MDRKSIKKYIVILLIVAILLMLIIAILNVSHKYANPNNEYIFPITDENIVEKVKSHRLYYSLINIVAKYYGYIGQKNEEAVYKTLDSEYLKNHVIDEVLQKITSEDPIFYAKEIYVQTNDEEYIYYVYGNVKEYLDSKELQDIYLKVYIDNNTEAFAILPINKEEYSNAISGKEKGAFKNIESNEYNTFEYLTISNITMATYIFNNYKQIINTDTQKAYDMLDKEYREKKFNSIQEYEKYLEDRKEINYSVLNKYNILEKDDYIEYTCMDQNGNKFIFKETFVMEYSAMLDDYTIDTQEFIDKYNSVTAQEKVILNIDKFYKSLNDKSYYFAYNFLADGFKNNYFKESEDFRKYMKTSIFEENEISYVSFSEESGLYKYTINIKNKEDETQYIQKTIIMKLGEGTNFELSFNVE